MSKRTDYAALADGCLARAAQAVDGAPLGLLQFEAGWRRLTLAFYDSAFGLDAVDPARLPGIRLAGS